MAVSCSLSDCVFMHSAWVGIWVISTLGGEAECTAVNIPVQRLIHEHITAFLLSKYLGMEFLDCGIENPFLMTKTSTPHDSNYTFNIPRLKNIQ